MLGSAINVAKKVHMYFEWGMKTECVTAKKRSVGNVKGKRSIGRLRCVRCLVGKGCMLCVCRGVCARGLGSGSAGYFVKR